MAWLAASRVDLSIALVSAQGQSALGCRERAWRNNTAVTSLDEQSIHSSKSNAIVQGEDKSRRALPGRSANGAPLRFV
jgi:hypothetical protein